MEFEQIGKRLEWLDEQQRQSKTSVGDLGSRLAALETSVNALTQQLRTLTKEMSSVSPASARIDQFEQMMSKQRTDLGKLLDGSEKAALRREQDSRELLQGELDDIRKSIYELGKSTNTEEINKTLRDRAHEAQRLSSTVQDMKAGVDAVIAQNKELVQSNKAIEEARRQDAKRLADLQGEISAMRKRTEDSREKVSVHSDVIRNLENRLNELLSTEASRQETQASFLAQQSMAQVERDRSWKDWQANYELFKAQADSMEAQLATLDDSIRAAKRAQESYTELNQKLDRRIAEVSEMQRLAEDRIRQEWVAFKAEEQKRWTGHALSQEESMRDFRKALDRIEQRMTALDDTTQTMQDQLHQTTDTTERQLQELMNVAHEWLTTYERVMGHGKTKARKTSR
jgi:chromosome segregation ATPase